MVSVSILLLIKDMLFARLSCRVDAALGVGKHAISLTMLPEADPDDGFSIRFDRLNDDWKAVAAAKLGDQVVEVAHHLDVGLDGILPLGDCQGRTDHPGLQTGNFLFENYTLGLPSHDEIGA